MASYVRYALERRAGSDDTSETWTDNDDDDVYWWYSKEGYIVKWTILAVIVLLFTLWIVGGYWHAKKRIQKGLRPLAYHRCFVSRSMMAQVDPRYAYPPNGYYYPPQQQGYGGYGPPGGYPMHSMPPPPVYDPSRPPMYEDPPNNGSKIDPAQGQPRQGEGPSDYYAPPGPPPPR
ncbi:ubiquitin ligase sel1 [Fusarium heterosporum]|uniref:Ubiquitin ligase sel1 n=1 Tax=Fusarium heterosporum TaxID=42747 RepID=A0A8H5T3I9_FUSHE|nr:ubiquitin ligase sel1 [Fusarium heterosporum]